MWRSTTASNAHTTTLRSRLLAIRWATLAVTFLLVLLATGCAERHARPTDLLAWGLKGAPLPSLNAPDHDLDGLENARDRCPDLPEDIDAYRDADGCPDPDNDGDGHSDVKP